MAVQKCQACKEKWWCLWTFQVCHNIKECLLNVKKNQKISHPKFFYSLEKEPECVKY
jgi:hypothetical protein